MSKQRFSFRLSSSAVLLGTVTALLLVSSSVLAETSGSSDSVPVPCGDAEGGLRDCEVVKSGSIELLRKKIRQQVDDWYQQKQPFYPRVCSLVPHQFGVTNPEVETNHFGASCGDWSEIRSWRCGRRHACAQIDASGERGGRERAYMAGAYMNAAQCALEQVSGEIRRGTLSVRACRAVGADQLRSVSAFHEQVRSTVGGAKARVRIDQCDAANAANAPSSSDGKLDSRSLDMDNCYLSVLRSANESTFQELAACEVLARSEVLFQRMDHDVFQPSTVQSRQQGWANLCKGAGDTNGCYRNQFQSFLKEEVRNRFGACGKGDAS